MTPIKNLTQGYEHIELTEDEIAQVLLDAKIAKDRKLTYEKNEELRRQKSRDITQPFTSLELLDYCHRFYVERFGKNYIVDEYNTQLVTMLCSYFTGSEDFELADYSLDKGLLIMGNVGTGKTELMKFFQKNKKQCYAIKTCNEVSESYSFYKDEIEDVYSTPIDKPLHDPSVFFQRKIGFCFDDLGTEEMKNNYGNKKNVMADLILAIYNKKDYSKFHITTNLSKDELTEKYGTRVMSRMREMFNVFVLSGKDRRK